jgi:hypothetical protein
MRSEEIALADEPHCIIRMQRAVALRSGMMGASARLLSLWGVTSLTARYSAQGSDGRGGATVVQMPTPTDLVLPFLFLLRSGNFSIHS